MSSGQLVQDKEWNTVGRKNKTLKVENKLETRKEETKHSPEKNEPEKKERSH